MPGAVSVPPDPITPAGGAYLEHAPPAALAAYVECFWSRPASSPTASATRSHRVVPDGCVDVLLTFDDGPRASAVGAMTRPVLFSDSSGTAYLGARFRPGVAGVLFGLPASELTDQTVPLAELWSDCDALCDTLSASRDVAGRIRLLSAAVARKLLAAPQAPPPTVAAAAERIERARGDLSIGVLAAELGVTRQHLARLFAEHVGVSPKLLARVVRARSVVERIRRRGDADWISLALDAGYYDQSHLIAELKELTGLPPTGWAAGTG